MVDVSVPGYRIIGKIADGGMYGVYKAARYPHEEVVAIKVMHAHLARDKSSIKTAKQEARLCLPLKHPHVIETTRANFDGPRPVLEMEYFPSRTLKALLHESKVTMAAGLHVASQVADAVSYLHGLGIIHKDLKPENVLVGKDWSIRLIDFSLAEEFGGGGWKKVLGFFGADRKVQGTLSYIAPEQLKNEQLDSRTDIYSLGILFYEIFSGRLPFAATDQKGLIQAHLRQKPEPLRRWNPEVHPDLERLILNMLAKDPAQRIQDIALVRNQLAKLQKKK